MAMLTKRTPSAASALGAVFLLITLLTGCSDDGTGGTLALSPTLPTDRTPTPTALPTATPPTFGRGPVVIDVDSTGQPAGILVDVRSAPHAEFDRIVFEFEDALPGYRIEYAAAPFAYCTSGQSLDLVGDAFIQARFASATAHVIEPRRLTLQLASLREAVITCDFEGDVTWLLGVTSETEFAVARLDKPLRIVIDIAHP
ncbi:MAG: hypothetical protein IIB88_04540 [Chloroflexi bacterium]|nr:hypothetical protein [Chloroflexota bacterium]